jgi:hypothetical protein
MYSCSEGYGTILRNNGDNEYGNIWICISFKPRN